MKKNIKLHKAKVSKALVLFMFLTLYVPIFIPTILGQKWSNGNWFYILFVSLLFGLILYLLYTTAYIIDGKILRIKTGFFTYKPIDITTIKIIKKTNNLLSSPAPSLDRIQIDYGLNQTIIISPKYKEQLKSDLLFINSSNII